MSNIDVDYTNEKDKPVTEGLKSTSRVHGYILDIW